MKKTMIFAVMLLIPLLAHSETVIKIGTMVTYGKVEEARFTLPSVELKFEQSLYKGLSIGIGIRKETAWAYSGYYFSLYPTYKMKLSKNGFVAASLGAEYGLASSEYDRYITTYDESGNLTVHKWIYLIQNAPIPSMLKKGTIGVVHPFATISYGTRIWKRLFLEAGFKVQTLKFGVKGCKFEPTSGKAYDIRNDRKLIAVPSAFIQIGYKL
jgi:hypothetical protein